MLVCPDVRGITTLGHNSGIRPDGAICIHLLGAVCFIIVFALAAFQARPRLSANTNPLSRLDECDLGAYSESFANNFVADSKWEVLFTPATSNGMNIAGAYTTALDLYFYVVVPKRLGVELVLVELRPGLRRFDLEALVLIEFRHFEAYN